MTKLRVVALPMFAASVLAGAAITIAWTTQPTVEASRSAEQEPTVQAFMALGTSAKSATGIKKVRADKPTTECIPCGQKGTESIAGHVPSRRPVQPIDGEYERITGRTRSFAVPSESGMAPVSSYRPQRGWLMIITGTPIRQTNAYVEIDADHLRVSRPSGALHVASTTYSLTALPQEPDARLLVESVAVFLRVSEHRAATWAREQQVGGMMVVSVSAREVYAVPTGVTWTPDAPQDLRIRLSSTGRITQMEYVRAQSHASAVAASRVVWFPEYDPQ